MLRILLWKIGFEWANLLRILRPEPHRRTYYFAFGANLSPDVLKRRRIQVFDSFNYVLEDSALAFSQRGFYRDHGYASADPAPGEVVYGRMYQISERDARRMDYYEGVPILNAHHKVSAGNGKLDFFFYRTRVIRSGLKPSREYLDYILNAYREMPEVPDTYISVLEKTPVLKEFRFQDKTGEFIRNIDSWPSALHPALGIYEGLCQRVLEPLWNRSLVQWMIKPT